MIQIPSCEEIAQRAYEIYLSRGLEHGHDVNDWLQAETQLKEEFTNATSTSNRLTSPSNIGVAATESLKNVAKPAWGDGKRRSSTRQQRT